MTSVKEFRVETPASDDALGRGAFYFTDDYSVFDWGKMPDPIPDKGASLCTMGAANFELLEAAGIATHYRGVVPAGEDAEDGDSSPGGEPNGAADPVPLGDVAEPPREMAIALAERPELPRSGTDYDYDAYYGAVGTNYVVPLEIVFRNAVPVGSSLRSRTDPADHGLDADEWPEEPVDLPDAVVEFSTKFEASDRYLNLAEADRIAGPASIEDLEALAREVNRVVTEHAEARGFTHEDGKIEVVYDDGALRVADVVGTFDENRFAYDGQELSKEVLRQYHKRTQPAWVEAVDAAKREAKARDVADWKSICEETPDPLPEDVLSVARDMYAAGANAYVGRELFDAPSIEDAVAAIRAL